MGFEGLPKSRQLTPEQIANIKEKRTISDFKLLEGGAKYKVNEGGKIELEPTKEQIEAAKEEMKISLQVEPEFRDFAPEEFIEDPVRYFEEMGKNIKSGEVKFDEAGKVREDPTATKDFPAWRNLERNELQVVAKRVNVEKAEVGKSGDPFYEYRVMQIAREFDLPAARPIAKIEHDKQHIILMEKIPGFRIRGETVRYLQAQGFSDVDIENLRQEAEAQIADLQKRFEAVGIYRGWKLKDMIVDVDLENKKVNKVTPTDWERTQIDEEKLKTARNLKSP